MCILDWLVPVDICIICEKVQARIQCNVIHSLVLSELSSASDQGLRVVFQYKGLLEAGPAGGYQRLGEPVRPARPGLVTWSPHTDFESKVAKPVLL